MRIHAFQWGKHLWRTLFCCKMIEKIHHGTTSTRSEKL
jgi:hypothetical protein